MIRTQSTRLWHYCELKVFFTLALTCSVLAVVAQDSSRSTEIGINLGPPLYKILDGSSATLDIELFAKISHEKYDIRFHAFRAQYPRHDDELVNSILVSEDPKFVRITNVLRQGISHGVGVGYSKVVKKWQPARIDLNIGTDFLIIRFNGVAQAYRHSCLNASDTASCIAAGGNTTTLYHTATNNYSGIGLRPFVGLKGALGRFRISVEVGVRIDFIWGDVLYVERLEPPGIDKIKYKTFANVVVPGKQWFVTQIGLAYSF